MKKILLILSLFLIGLPALSKTIPVQALEDFSSTDPPTTYSLVVLDDLMTDENTILFKCGDVLNGKIIDVKPPKRLKQNAAFTFVPLTITDFNGTVSNITGYYPARYTTKLDKANIAKIAALGVGSYFIKGLSLGYNAIEGAVKNEKDNRFKSSVNSIYENSPLSYIEKGHELIIEREQYFLLNFKINNIPNYEYFPIENEGI